MVMLVLERSNELDREIHQLRERVKKLLSQYKNKQIASNLPSQERRGKRKAKEDKDRVYLPAHSAQTGEGGIWNHNMKLVFCWFKFCFLPHLSENKERYKLEFLHKSIL